MQQLKKREDTATTDQKPSPHPFVLAHRTQRMEAILLASLDSLRRDGPDESLKVLLEGIGEPVQDEKRHEQPQVPLRLQLMDARIQAELEFDRTFLEVCVPPFVADVIAKAKSGYPEIYYTEKTLHEVLFDLFDDDGDWYMLELRLSAWLRRQGVDSDVLDDRFVVYIPERS